MRLGVISIPENILVRLLLILAGVLTPTSLVKGMPAGVHIDEILVSFTDELLALLDVHWTTVFLTGFDDFRAHTAD